MSPLDQQRRGALLASKLTALVRDRAEAGELVARDFPGGASVRSGDSGWVLIEDEPERGLGPALAWARRHEVSSLNVVSDRHAGHLARRASLFRRPPSVWTVDGDRLVEAEPTPPPRELPPPRDLGEARRLLESADLDVIVEHGSVTGEVAGLEVARIITGEGGARLDVGVGRNDRDATAMVHGEVPTADVLASVIQTVRRERRPGAPSHPLNRLAADRWLRSRLVDQPHLIGLSDLEPRSLTFVRTGLRAQYPAAALGTDSSGRQIVVVCSVGVDLDLVPTAADVRLAVDGRVDALWLALPARDDVPVTRWMAGELTEPAELVPFPGDWRDVIER